MQSQNKEEKKNIEPTSQNHRLQYKDIVDQTQASRQGKVQGSSTQDTFTHPRHVDW